VIYTREDDLDAQEAREVYVASGLAERRPVERLPRMLAGSNLVVTARQDDGRLIGLARSISDGAYATYLSDLAVVAEHQRTGVGRALVERTHDEVPETRLILLAAPAAVGYYPRIGMERHPAAFTLAPRPPT
jgi:GNAT superfamily N-acetyltransferase